MRHHPIVVKFQEMCTHLRTNVVQLRCLCLARQRKVLKVVLGIEL